MYQEITLLAAARKMDEGALTEIFELYAPALYKYAFRLCNNAAMADQVVGDVFGKFIEQLEAGRISRLILRSCLYEIAYGILVREGRYANYFVPTDLAVRVYPGHRSKNLGVDEQKLFDVIQQALRYELTDDQHHVLILRFMEGFSLKETASIIGKKVNNVKVIQNRGLAALRKALDYQAVETTNITFFLRRMAQAYLV